ncbi:MAG: hypothetical protein OXI40_03020 [Chloroflexota bacterium]|nr:hypothetical protein [Chloroflexota bacterium]
MGELPLYRSAAAALMPLMFLTSRMTALAQDAEATSSPAGLAMLVLFLGIAGIVGVFVIRWSQSTTDDDE